MKKSILTFLLLLAVTVGSWAVVRPVHQAFPHHQSDGTTVMAYLHGDGFEAYYTTTDGKVLMRDADDNLCYAVMQDGKLVASSFLAHEANARTSAETSFLAANSIDPNSKAVLRLAVNEKQLKWNNRRMKALQASTTDGLGRYGQMSGGDVPSLGNLTIPVIMVQFSDRSFQAQDKPEKMTRMYNEQGYHDEPGCVGSVKDYFTAQSNGAFVPTFQVVATVTLDNPYSYYGRNSGSSGNDANMSAFRSEAIQKAVDQGVNFRNFYVNGRVPLVTFLYAGGGEATGGGSNTIWPHFQSLTNNFLGTPYYTNYSGFEFGSYFVGNEIYGNSSSTTLMGIGVFVHEFGHALGLPDFYVTDYSYQNDSPFGYWSVMDDGEYYAGSYAPVGYNAYEKSFMGWLDIEQLSAPAGKRLQPGEAVLIRNANDNNEYFILENRQPSTWYPSALGSGLLAMRFAYNRNAWYQGTVNNSQNYKRAMVITADGSSINNNGFSSQLFGNGVANIPAFNLFNGTQQTTTPVYRISKHNDGTITLNFIDRSFNNALAGSRVYYRLTDASQLQSGDSVIFVNEADHAALSTNFTGTNRMATDILLSQDTAFATSEVAAYQALFLPSRNLWAFRNDGAFLAQSGSNWLTTQATADNKMMATIAVADGNAQVRFQGIGRPYIVYDPDGFYFRCGSEDGGLQIYTNRQPAATGISSVRTDKSTKADAIYTITGQRISRSAMHHGMFIVNGKKVVVKD